MPAMKRGRAGTRSNPIVIGGKAKRTRTNGYTRTSGNFGRFAAGSHRGHENKWFDTADTAVTIAAAGTVIAPSLNLLSAGTGESQLIGRSCIVKAIQLKGTIKRGVQSDATISNVVPDTYVKVALILDTQANGAAMTIAQMFQDTDIRTFNDLENSKRFRVLKEWCVEIDEESQHNGTTYFVGGAVRKMEGLYMKSSTPLEYGATPSGVITDLKSNNLALVGFCENAAGGVTMDFRTRIRYSDA
ncbi:putative capsid protein [uncultured virus]|uniref:Putative capsid protein n=1 Tax=uncultured virus TaxID=340016 RepID=A0A1I9XGE8_9VIRU|nr:putative capsid protein [uncultured virus]